MTGKDQNLTKKTNKAASKIHKPEYIYRTYYSNFQKQPAPAPKKRRKSLLPRFLIVLLIVVIAVTASASNLFVSTKNNNKTVKQLATTKVTPGLVGVCSGNAAGNQLVVVSISLRHMWACNGVTVSFSTPVITGYEGDPQELTPVGTYQISDKQTNISLIGSDNRGSWDDYVLYWLPFLDNQFGEYGFHDATWRSASDFGAISSNSPNASHGCVELPLSAAQWLYGWAQIGTSVKIEA